MFTPKSVIYPCTSNPDEILVSGVDENDRPVNAPIITDAALAKQFAHTPTMLGTAEPRTLPNPNAHLDPTPIPNPAYVDPTPNPAYQLLVDQAFLLAQAAITEHAERLK